MWSNLMNSLITYLCTNVVEFDDFFNNHEFRGIQFNSGIPMEFLPSTLHSYKEYFKINMKAATIRFMGLCGGGSEMWLVTKGYGW